MQINYTGMFGLAAGIRYNWKGESWSHGEGLLVRHSSPRPAILAGHRSRHRTDYHGLLVVHDRRWSHRNCRLRRRIQWMG